MKLLAGSGARLVPDTAAASGFLGKGIAYVATNLSPALLGVGYIVGLNVGIVVVAGGILSWNVAIPVYSTFLLDGNAELAARIAGASADAAASAIWSTQIRYLGVGAMLIGGLWTLVSLRKSILSGIRSGLAATRAGAARVVAHTEQDLPMKPVLIAVVIFALPLLVLYQAIVADFTVSVPMTVIMIVAGFLFCSVSAYMAGLIGSSNNPVSGITIATIIFASLVLIALMGRGAPLGPIAAIMIGAVVCCAAAVAGDNLQDLKAGRIVGATPWRQQVMLAIGAVSCAFVMAPVLNLLEKAYGIGVPYGGASEPAARPAGDSHGIGFEGHVRRRAAVGHGLDRRGDRGRDHHSRRDPQGARRALSHARARRVVRHLPAARVHRADFPRRPHRVFRRAKG